MYIKISNIIIRYNKKVQQNLEYKLKSLHLSKAFLSGLICWGGVYFQESLYREYKNIFWKKVRKPEKILISKVLYFFSYLITLM